MDQTEILGIVRHVLTTAGGALVANGYATSGQAQDAIGAIMVLIGLGWSLYQKQQQKAAVITAAASGLPVQATVASAVKAAPADTAAMKGLTP
jgi:hypothetical protein